MSENKLKKHWDTIPEKGILPNDTKQRMWKHIEAATFKRKRFFYRYAAAASMLLFISLGSYWIFNSNKPETILVQTHTLADDIRLLTLPDGTKVWVNQDTEISYPEEFVGNKREITLSGEAYFEVTKNPSKPFIIHSGAITTTVLGTSFDVRAYAGFAPKVVVNTGKVKVASATQEVFLLKGDAVTFIENQERMVKGTRQITQPEWKKVLLDVEGLSLAQLIEKLQQDYDFSVSYETDAIKNLTMKGTLDTRQRMPDMLHTIAFALDLKVKETTPNHFTISFKINKTGHVKSIH